MNGRSLPVFSERDVTFVIETAGSRLKPRKTAMSESYAVMEQVLDENNDRILERVLSMEEERVLVAVSPRLLFETFLRKAKQVLSRGSYLLERVGRQVVPVFEAPEVGDFLSGKGIVPYLADMLVSFCRIESFTLLTGVKNGVWQRLRLNTMDIDSLLRFCSFLDEESCFPFYKRAADVCLFVAGIFPESALVGEPPGVARPPLPKRGRTMEEYEREGREYYGRAAFLPAARAAGTDNVMRELAGRFRAARKSLNFLSDAFLGFRKGSLFSFDV